MPISRLDFLRKIGIAAGTVLLPEVPVREVIVYDKLYLLHCFVRGFQYYQGPNLLSRMKQGDQLELVREPDNDYDPDAIALHWNQQKIGFVPAESNEVLSKLLDIGFPALVAEVTHLEPDAATWESVSVAVSVLRPRPAGEDLPETALALQSLDTPNYRSVKLSNSRIARVYWDDVIYEPEEEADWYTNLVDFSRDDGIYDMIHSNLHANTYGNGRHTYALSREDAQKLAKQLPDTAAAKAEAAVAGLEDYLLLRSQEAEEVIPLITDLIEVIDQAGNKFIRLVVS